MAKRTDDDTLSRIVRDAKRKEREINRQHPERHGYGFMAGEANDFIRRIEWLETIQERAQQAKVNRRVGKISIMSNDKLYSRSPEDLYIEYEHRQELARKIRRARQNIPKQNGEIIVMYHTDDFTQQELADMFDLNQSTVSRAISAATKELGENLKREVKDNGV